MTNFIQDVLLSQWTVLIILVGIFGIFSRWVLMSRHDYRGYALGVLVGLFFIVVYAALAGEPPEDAAPVESLPFIQVVLATFFGLVFGGAVLVGMRLGSQHLRVMSLQIAFYVALNIILIFVALVEPTTIMAIGIFALAFSISTVFGVVLATGNSPNSMQAQSFNAQGAPPQFDKRATSRLDQIRDEMENRDRR